VAAGLRSLRDDDVRARCNTALGLGDASGHQCDLAAGVVGAIDVALQILIGPGPSQRDCRWLFLQRCGKAILFKQKHQKIERKRFFGAVPDCSRGLMDLNNGELMTSLSAKSTGLTNRSDQFRAGVAATQAAERDGILNS
jgi:hypothetical protein